MEIIKINSNNPEGEAVFEAAAAIKKGGSIVLPTETVYGLAADALNQKSIERLFKIKKRSFSKPVPVLVKDIEMAKKFAYVDKQKEKFLAGVWPGPVTVVLEKRKNLPSILSANQRTIGLRISNHVFVQELMEQLDVPITGTSANFSGHEPISYSYEVLKNFIKAHPGPDLFLDAGDLEASLPSSVIDLTGLKPKILRMGPVSKKDLLGMLGK